MTDKELTIRRASAADINHIVAFQLNMAEETEGKVLDAEVVEKGVGELLQQPNKGRYFLADFGGRVVGNLLIKYEWSDWRNASFWWIHGVYIEPTSRRQGVYSAMHNHIMRLAKSDRAVCGVRLYVDRDNKAAQSTYNRLGMSKSRYDMYEVAFGC